jgi:hypothetical protein
MDAAEIDHGWPSSRRATFGSMRSLALPSTPAARGVAAALALAGTACAPKTTVVHGSLGSARATPTEMGFGLGLVDQQTRGLGSSSSATDKRVDHAAAVSKGSAADLVWRTRGDTITTEFGPLATEVLVLCDGPDTRSCVPVPLFSNDGKSAGPVIGQPTFIEDTNLGVTQRRTASSSSAPVLTSSGVSTIRVDSEFASGSVGAPQARRATPNAGVWVLETPVAPLPTLFNVVSSATGPPPIFCHAPAGEPRCTRVPDGTGGVGGVLSVHVLAREDGVEHVVWFAAVQGDAIVRCRADDAEGKPTCNRVEVRQ